MKFRYHSEFHDPGLKKGYTRLLADIMKEIRFAERAGFDGVWLGEHHLGPEGLSNGPNPILLLSHICATTDFATYGLCCLTTPNWHPIRLAEDIAILDHLTGGKVHVGLGRGVFHRDTAPFHPNADCRIEASRTLTGEVIDVLKNAWSNEFFQHKGPNYTLPPPGIPHHPWSPTEEPYVDADGNITHLCLLPKPVQKPYPQIWVMVATEASARLAAEQGYNCIAGGTAINIIRDWLSIYADIRSKREGRSFAIGEGWALQQPFYVAATAEAARRDFEPFIRRQREYQALYRGAKAGDYVKQTLGNASDWDWELMRKTAMLAGSAEQVGERLQQLSDLGIEAVNLWTDAGGLPHERGMESLELFVAEVLPKLNRRSEKALASETQR